MPVRRAVKKSPGDMAGAVGAEHRVMCDTNLLVRLRLGRGDEGSRLSGPVGLVGPVGHV